MMEEEYNTLEYYNKNAQLYYEQTLVGNLQEIYDRFLKELPNNAYILDFHIYTLYFLSANINNINENN